MRSAGLRAWVTAGSLALALSVLMVPTLQATAAHAADASGCSGQATSYDDKGVPIDAAAAPGEGGTAQDPLDLLWAGTLEWSGTTDEVLQNGEYGVTVAPKSAGKVVEFLVSMASDLAFSGEVTNDGGKQTAEGTVVPADLTAGVPLLTGTYQVTWKVTGEAGACTGTGYIKVIDKPWKSVTWWVALILILLGFTGLLLARPTVRPGKR